MAKNIEDFSKIKAIFSDLEGVEAHDKHGGKFHFTIYLTESMENTDIEALELSVRSYNCLKRAGIITIGDLCSRVTCSEDLKGIRNCGKTSIAEIMDHLFFFNYMQLRPERRDIYLLETIKKNTI